ncbi:MAG: DUF6318 family protein [Actinomycetaceae bacterium]|nr:DUF6318 family protein [Actinomycetaceae bacterium]
MKCSPRLIGALSVLSLSTFTLVACGETGAAEPTSPPTTVATTQVTEEPTTVKPTVPPNDVLYPHPVPEMPPEAYEHSLLGAQAFTVYFFQTYAYAVSMRDPQPLQDIMLPDSVFLTKTVDFLEEIRNQRSYYVGYNFENIRVNGSMPAQDNPDAEWGTQLSLDVPEYTFWNGESGTEISMEAERIIGATEVLWDEGWIVSEANFRDWEEVYGNE